MLTTLLLLSATLAADAGAPWTDPFDPATWASYWPEHSPAPAVTLPPKPIPATMDSAALHAGPWARADFIDPPDARPLDPDAARAMAAALAQAAAEAEQVDALLATRQGQRIVNSAILCRVVVDLTAEGQSTTVARRRLAVLGEAAASRMEHARIALDVLAIQPLACDAYPVERLVGCLGLLPGPECTTDADLAAQVRAAERLGTP